MKRCISKQCALLRGTYSSLRLPLRVVQPWIERFFIFTEGHFPANDVDTYIFYFPSFPCDNPAVILREPLSRVCSSISFFPVVVSTARITSDLNAVTPLKIAPSWHSATVSGCAEQLSSQAISDARAAKLVRNEEIDRIRSFSTPSNREEYFRPGCQRVSNLWPIRGRGLIYSSILFGWERVTLR